MTNWPVKHPEDAREVQLEPTSNSDRTSSPTSEFILRRILKNDIQGTPGWRLNPEMRGEFTRMLREREDKKAKGMMR